jgi:hypothetical protein
MDFKVGQIIYIIHALDGKKVLIPFRVSEKIFKETLSGTETKYRVEYGSQEKIVLDNLEQFADRVFLSIEDARASLLDQAKKTVDMLISSAQAKTVEMYGEQPVVEIKKKEDDLKN